MENNMENNIVKKENKRKNSLKRRKKQYIRLVTSIAVSVVCIIMLGVIYVSTRAESDVDKKANIIQNDMRNKKNKTEKNKTDKNKAERSTEKQKAEEEQTTEKKPLVTLAGREIPEYVLSLDRNVGNCGYSTVEEVRDENNRPTTVCALQEKYGEKCNAVFLGENEKKVYFTYTITTEYYHDGKSILRILLDQLDKHNIKAAFFVTGEYVTSNPEMCKEIVSRGHILGGHGYMHPDEQGMASFPPEKQVEDAVKMAEAIKAATGVDIKYYRPDSGRFSEMSLAILKELGYKSVMYSYAYPDWDVENQPDEEETLKAWLYGLHNGEIMYLHAVSMTSINVLPRFVEEIKNRGYEIGTIE